MQELFQAAGLTAIIGVVIFTPLLRWIATKI